MLSDGILLTRLLAGNLSYRPLVVKDHSNLKGSRITVFFNTIETKSSHFIMNIPQTEPKRDYFQLRVFCFTHARVCHFDLPALFPHAACPPSPQPFFCCGPESLKKIRQKGACFACFYWYRKRQHRACAFHKSFLFHQGCWVSVPTQLSCQPERFVNDDFETEIGTLCMQPFIPPVHPWPDSLRKQIQVNVS